MPDRVVLDPPLAPMQLVCVTLAALGYSAEETAEFLRISVDTARSHIWSAGEKIPGDLPPRLKGIAWARGATMEVLTGDKLKAEIMTAGQGSPLPPLFPELSTLVGSGEKGRD
ncbi:MAG: helix-turn-helix transcriptional regulator [Mycobacteriales bacterium]